MRNFKERLYEALLFSFGKILAKYNIFAQDSILKDVGKEIIEYLNAYGFEFKETDSLDDLPTLIELFYQNGFVDKLEIESAEKGAKYIWKNIYGFDAYRELLDVSENPFLSCPLNASLYYLADKHNKTLRLHKKSFDTKNRVVESQEEIVDREASNKEGLDSLVVENARLYELAEESASTDTSSDRRYYHPLHPGGSGHPNLCAERRSVALSGRLARL